MAVYSMTGYASLHVQPGSSDDPSGCQLGLDIRSVNSRFLDLTFKLNDDLKAAEPILRDMLGKAFKRGKIEIRGWVEGRNESAARTPSPGELQRLNGLQDSIRAWLPDAPALSVAEVIQLTSRHTSVKVDLTPQFLELAESGIQALKDARGREGERLADMLLSHCAQLETLADKARPLIPELVEQQRLRFLSRWQEAMGASSAAVDTQAAHDRALTEATAYAIRIDVAEELIRLRSHLVEIQTLVRRGGELGKRLDFLIQELHREANTLGSKSTSLELTRVSVDMKVLIEQMREQVQNLE